MAEKEDYEKIVSPQTFQTLKGKSAQALKAHGKSGHQSTMEAVKILHALMKIEEPYIQDLEDIAVYSLEKAFPLVRKAGIEIQAKLVKPGVLGGEPQKPEEDNTPPEIQLGANKRRLINAITQGASMRESKIYEVFEDALDELDIRLVRQYNKLLDLSFGAHNDDDYTAMLKEMLKLNRGGQAGESEGYYDEENDKLVIKAEALVFPLLIHELVKGLYEIVSLHGFSGDPEANKKIIKQVDLPQSEPEDFQYGPHIYDALKAVVDKSPYKDVPGIRELFFKEVYTLDDYDFIEFIEDVINDRLTSQEQNWINRTLKTIHDEID